MVEIIRELIKDIPNVKICNIGEGERLFPATTPPQTNYVTVNRMSMYR